MPWTIVYHQAAAEELAQQPADIRAKLDYIAELVVVFGLQHLPGKYARHLRGPLWEFRLKGKDGIARALYVTGRGQRVIIVRVFAKKTQKTPPREIELALARANEVT